MSKQENLPQTSRVQREMSEQLIAMFGFSHPQVFSLHLDRMFSSWNGTDEADDLDTRRSVQFSLQMMKDFFFIFSKEDPGVVALALKELSNLIQDGHEEE